LAIYYGVAAYARFMEKKYAEAIVLARDAVRQRGDLTGAYRVLTVAAGMSGDLALAATALQELRRIQPNISLEWIANQLPWRFDGDREHYLEGFRRAGLDQDLAVPVPWWLRGGSLGENNSASVGADDKEPSNFI